MPAMTKHNMTHVEARMKMCQVGPTEKSLWPTHCFFMRALLKVIRRTHFSRVSLVTHVTRCCFGMHATWPQPMLPHLMLRIAMYMQHQCCQRIWLTACQTCKSIECVMDSAGPYRS